MRIILLMIFTVLISGCFGSPGINAYHRGNEAFSYGCYDVSFANYLYAAHEFCIPAEYALAYQYYYGLGTKRNEAKAIYWFKRAAHFSPRARFALHLIEMHAPPQPWLYHLR